jgi:3-oxoacyl-[acyl-carrier protein] reductase
MSDRSVAAPTPVPPASVVLVSGGSRGLGRAIVDDLLSRGVRVATFARTVTPELAELVAKYEGSALAASVDAADRPAVDAYLRRVEAELGPVDGLVNNAAIGQDSLHIHTSPDAIANIINVNLTAPLLLARAVIRRIMARGGRGRVVSITSICAQRGFPGLAAYAATKGGMEAATRALAREFRDRVLINCVAPGFFASEMSSVLGQTELDAIVRRTPTDRLSEPSDVLPLVRMLLLDDTNMQGQAYMIDGGAAS